MILVAPPIERDVLRLREEFTSLPGLTLTAAQTARLLNVREAQAAKMLAELEEEDFLECAATGVYFRHRVYDWKARSCASRRG